MTIQENSSDGFLCLCANQLSDQIFISNEIKNLLESCTVLVFESPRHARKVLKAAGLHKEHWTLSEHQEQETIERVTEAFTNRESVFYMSDHGDPGFEDPGHYLTKLAYEFFIPIKITGCSSALGGILSAAPFKPQPFIYASLLPKKKNDRISRLYELKKQTAHIVLLDTPYRFSQLCSEIKQVFSPSTKIVVAQNIGFPNQKYYYLPVKDLEGIPSEKADLFICMIQKNKD